MGDSNLLEKFKKLAQHSRPKIDDEWKDLYDWAKTFRERYKLSCSEFMILLTGDCTTAQQQFLTTRSLRQPPSNRPGTVGRNLRDILKYARNNPEMLSSVETVSNLSKERLQDWAIEFIYDKTSEIKEGCKISVLSYDPEARTLEVNLYSPLHQMSEEDRKAYLVKNFKEFLQYKLEVKLEVEVKEFIIFYEANTS